MVAATITGTLTFNLKHGENSNGGFYDRGAIWDGVTKGMKGLPLMFRQEANEPIIVGHAESEAFDMQMTDEGVKFSVAVRIYAGGTEETVQMDENAIIEAFDIVALGLCTK